MTKTSGRKVKCMTCGRGYSGGKGDHQTCPYCTGRKVPPDARRKDKGKRP